MNKKLLVLIVFLLLLIPFGKIDALSDSFYVGEYINGAYLNKLNGNSGKYEQMRVFRRRSDNRVVYCIELWEGLNEDKVLTGYDNKQYVHANINSFVWNRIMLIAYYGYGYGNHTSDNWIAATQYMIWKETSPDSTIYFTDTLNGRRVDKFTDEINEINTLVENYYKVSSFSNKTYQTRYKEELVIVDKNNALEQFDITGDSGFEVEKRGNTLSVKQKVPGERNILFAKQDKMYNTKPTVYIDEVGQDVLAPGSTTPIYMAVNFNLPESNITVNKLDIETKTNIAQGDASLKNSVFQLIDYDGVVIADERIDENGQLVFQNIGYGNYKLKEIRAGEGYLLNEEVIPIEVNEEHEEFNFYNQVIKGTIKITKYVKNPITNKSSREKDASFSVYNRNNEKVTTFTTDSDGMYELVLPFGIYTIKQDTGMKNHRFVDDFTVQITENNSVQEIDLYNEEIIMNVRINNIDSESRLPILESGAKFQIKNIETGEYVEDTDGNILELTTDDFGNTDMVLLSYGKYQIEQIQSVSGYIVNEEVYYFEVSDQFSIYYLFEIFIPNDKKTSKIEIIRKTEYYVDDNLIDTIENHTITVPVYAKEDIYSKDGIRLYSKDEQVSTAVWNQDKIITLPLYLGNYYIENPIDNNIIEISLQTIENKKIELVDKVYEYTNDKGLVIEVPNTYLMQTKKINFGSIFILIGFVLSRSKNTNEKKDN